jgi:hypothetical protein
MNAYQNLPKNAIDFQPSALSPWPFVVVRPNTVARQFVARRFHADPALADLVADLAGIGSEVQSLKYPAAPGFKSRGTSSSAARRIAPHAEALCDRVFAFLKANYPAAFTADEVADRLGQSFLSVRPRLSELGRSELIEPTLERRKNRSGMLAKCWRAAVSSRDGAL